MQPLGNGVTPGCSCDINPSLIEKPDESFYPMTTAADIAALAYHTAVDDDFWARYRNVNETKWSTTRLTSE